MTLASLITARRLALGLSEAALLAALGFRNPSKGTALMMRLATGDLTGVEHLRRPLAAALGLPLAEIDAAIAESRERRRRDDEAAWRAAFRPHAVLTTSHRVPQPIFAAALAGSGRRCVIELPADLPVLRWPRAVAGRLPEGVPRFGRVTGFVINYTPDRAVRFDRAARPVETLEQAYRRGTSRLRGLSAAAIGAGI